MDIISQLEGFPYVLENIFLYLDITTISETEKVSSTWKRLISSTNLWKRVWKTNVKRSSTWKTLSVRMEDVRPLLSNRMKEGIASSYEQACLYVDGNVRQIAQPATKNFKLKDLIPKKDIKHFSPNRIRLNDKYIFIVGSNNSMDTGEVRIHNRWTKQLVKKFVCPYGNVIGMQLNELFLVVQLRDYSDLSDQIEVYDLQKLVHSQTLQIKKIPNEIASLGLGSEVLIYSRILLQDNEFIINVNRWNLSGAQFVSDTETEHQLEVDSVTNCGIYIDEKYLIFDLECQLDGEDEEFDVRLFKVYSLETMQLVRERHFVDDDATTLIRNEYHDGGIVVWTHNDSDEQSFFALWDVAMDTVQPIADFPSEFNYSFAMDHHSNFQIVAVGKGNDEIQLLRIQRRQLGPPTRNSVIALPSECSFYNIGDNLYLEYYYYDGLQMLVRSQYRVLIADLVG